MKKTRRPKRQATVIVKLDWRFRMLRNQAINYFAKKDQELRRTLHAALKPAKTYTDVELAMRDHAVDVKNGGPTWHDFMNWFFKATVQKRVRRAV